ncbi:hypothetical protein KMW40_24725 [Enterobacter cloacae]|uniref:hypothetical protein n=1 Tax=Enterobacter cloacae TaxID=550 RepID=UPI0034A29EAF
MQSNRKQLHAVLVRLRCLFISVMTSAVLFMASVWNSAAMAARVPGIPAAFSYIGSTLVWGSGAPLSDEILDKKLQCDSQCEGEYRFVVCDSKPQGSYCGGQIVMSYDLGTQAGAGKTLRMLLTDMYNQKGWDHRDNIQGDNMNGWVCATIVDSFGDTSIFKPVTGCSDTYTPQLNCSTTLSTDHVDFGTMMSGTLDGAQKSLTMTTKCNNEADMHITPSWSSSGLALKQAVGTTGATATADIDGTAVQPNYTAHVQSGTSTKNLRFTLHSAGTASGLLSGTGVIVINYL